MQNILAADTSLMQKLWKLALSDCVYWKVRKSVVLDVA